MPGDIERATYLTDVSRLSFGECRRFGEGLLQGSLFWIFARFVKPQGEMQLPTDYDEVEASAEDMTANFEECHASWRQSFEDRGFRPVGWQKIRSSKDPKHIDSGSVIHLSADSRLIGILNLLIASDETRASGIKVTEGCSVSFYLSGGRSVSVTNLGVYLNPRPGSRVVCMKGAGLPELHDRAKALADRAGSGVLSFGGWPDLRATMQKEELENFLHRRDVRRLFVKKTD